MSSFRDQLSDFVNVYEKCAINFHCSYFRNLHALETMDKYDVIKVIGEGAFGKACLAKGKSDSKHCVIKEVNFAKVK